MQIAPNILLQKFSILEEFEGPILTHWKTQTGKDFVELLKTRTLEGFLVSIFYEISNPSYIEKYLKQEISLRILLNWENQNQTIWKITYQPLFFEVEVLPLFEVSDHPPAIDAFFCPDLAPQD